MQDDIGGTEQLLSGRCPSEEEQRLFGRFFSWPRGVQRLDGLEGCLDGRRDPLLAVAGA